MLVKIKNASVQVSIFTIFLCCCFGSINSSPWETITVCLSDKDAWELISNNAKSMYSLAIIFCFKFTGTFLNRSSLPLLHWDKIWKLILSYWLARLLHVSAALDATAVNGVPTAVGASCVPKEGEVAYRYMYAGCNCGWAYWTDKGSWHTSSAVINLSVPWNCCRCGWSYCWMGVTDNPFSKGSNCVAPPCWNRTPSIWAPQHTGVWKKNCNKFKFHLCIKLLCYAQIKINTWYIFFS